MKILVTDKFSKQSIDDLKSTGAEVIHNPELKDAALAEAAKSSNCSILVVRSTKVTEQILQASPALQLVVRAGAGVNTIDVGAASRLGIFVTNCPGKNSIAVAELTLGLLLALDRRIPDNVSQLREGKWNKGEFSKAEGLRGRTLGLIGVGNIGAEVAHRAKAFGLKLIAWSRSLTPEKAEELGIECCSSPLEVAKRADIVSVHVALTKETTGLCGKEFFEAMKPKSLFINTARAEIVDESALLNALNAKGIRAGLDVFGGEPSGATAEWKSEISTHPSVIGTHHIGASTEEAQSAIGQEALRIIRVFIERGEVLNCVNIDLNPPSSHVLNVRHINEVGVLASVLSEIQRARINVLNMENKLFEGDEAAIASIALSEAPSAPTLEAIQKNCPAIISLSLIPVR